MFKKANIIVFFVSTFIFFLLSTNNIIASGTFIFTETADYGYSNTTSQVLDKIGASGTNFHFVNGDLSYGIIPEQDWCNYVHTHIGPSLPIEIVLGNHETDEDVRTSDINKFVVCLPQLLSNISGSYPKEYYFDYQGLARFIQISPNITSGNETIAYVPGNSHYSWLANVIDDARLHNIPWLIVSMHENCITAATKTCEIGTGLLDLLVSKKVDLIMQAHDHTYQRSKQLSFGTNCLTIPINTYNPNCVTNDGSANTYQKGMGSVIIIDGTGGDSLYNINTLDPEAPYFAKLMGANLNPTYGFFKGIITQDLLSGSFEGISGMSGFTDSFTISAPNSSDSFNGEYYNNTTLSGSPSLIRQDSQINFDWGLGSPASGINSDKFSVRWTKSQYFDAGSYRFSLTGDDGVRLKIDGITVIDKWKDQGPTTYTYDTVLSAANHTIVVEYYENTEGAVAKLSLQTITPSSSPTPTPTASPTIAPTPTITPLTPTPTATPINSDTFTGQYYTNMTLSGTPAVIRNDNNINFDWLDGQPVSGIPADRFSVRWTKNQQFSSGAYQFSVTADDGVRLFLDGITVIDKWKDQGPTTYTYTLTLSQGIHQIMMEYYENTEGAVAKLNWVQNPSTSTPTSSPIPTPTLTPIATSTPTPTQTATPTASPTPAGTIIYRGEYFSNISLSGTPRLTRDDSGINFDWVEGSPDASIPADNFSVRWTGNFNSSNKTYRFTTTSDDGIRLKIDGLTVIDKWIDQGATTYSYDAALTSGSHTIVVEYYERTEAAVAKLSISAI